MRSTQKWLKSWAVGVVFFLCALLAWQASAQTLVEGRTAAGARKTVLVDATGALVAASTSAGAVAAMSSTMALATLGQAVRAGLFQYTAGGWVATDTTHPLPVKLSDGTNLVSPPWGLAGLGAATNCVALDTAGQEIAITDGWYRIKAIGNSACLLSGAAGATNAALTCGAGTMSYQMSEGEVLIAPITDAVLAVKAPTTVTGDLLCVMRLNGAT